MFRNLRPFVVRIHTSTRTDRDASFVLGAYATYRKAERALDAYLDEIPGQEGILSTTIENEEGIER